ncbi:lytic transglycosylase domain-containing protein [Thermotoga sp. KOL6]|uniref:lytic transglycosylase domain-containing protein n=1 Tax=Thermotoga sp. KOL6 TaxID=126741 RepID=UPI000C795156|nr:lytic transglycosylase domain-containing protein [Thermotoga sp. KOL6]
MKKITILILVLILIPIFLSTVPQESNISFRELNTITIKEWFKDLVRSRRGSYKLKTDEDFLEDLWQTINRAARETNFDPILIISVIDVESDFRNVIGLYGELGMMQIKKETAEMVANIYGLEPPESGWTELIWNYRLNIKYGSHYLKYLYEKFNSLRLALEYYNGGNSRKTYAKKILETYQMFKKELGI